MKKLLCTVISLLTIMALMVSTVILPASSQSPQEISVANNSTKIFAQNFETKSLINYDFNDTDFPTDLTMGSMTQEGLSIVDRGDGDKAVKLDYVESIGNLGVFSLSFDYGFYKVIPVKSNTNYTYSFDAKITNSQYDLPEDAYISGYRGGAFFVGGAPSSTATPSECTSLLDNANNVCYEGVNWKSTQLYKDNANGVIAPEGWGYKVGFGTTAEDEWHNYSVTFNSGDNDYIVVSNFVIYTGSVALELDNLSLKEALEENISYNSHFAPTISTDESGNSYVKIDCSGTGGATGYGLKLKEDVEIEKNKYYRFSFDYKQYKTDGTNPNVLALLMYRGSENLNLTTKTEDFAVSPSCSRWGSWGDIFVNAVKDEWTQFEVVFYSGEKETFNFSIVKPGTGVIELDNIFLEEMAVGGLNETYENATSARKEFSSIGANIGNVEIVKTNTGENAISLIPSATSQAVNNYVIKNIPVKKNTDYLLSIDARLPAESTLTSPWTAAKFGVRTTAGTDLDLDKPVVDNGKDATLNAVEYEENSYRFLPIDKGGWHTYTVKFNSGENTILSFFYGVVGKDEEIHFDNFKLAEGSVLPAPSENDPLITNGGFETSSIYGYTVGTGISSEIKAEEKNQYAEFTFTKDGDTNNSVKLEKNVIIEPNTVYTLSMRMKDDPALGWAGSALKVLLDGNSIDLSNLNYTQEGNVEGNTFEKFHWGYAFVTKHTDWKDVKITFDSGNCTTFNFNIIKAKAGSLCFDDITLTAVGDANAVLGNVNADENNLIDICDLVRLAVSLDNNEVNIAQSADVNLDSVIDEYDVGALRSKLLFTVEGENLAIDRISSVTPGKDVYMGDTIDYIVTIRNTGSAPISKIEYTETLPEGLTFVSGNGFANDGQNISWPKKITSDDVDGATLLPNDVYILKYTVSVTSAENGKILTCNSATVKDINLDSISYKITEWTGTKYTLLKKNETNGTQFDGCDFVIQLGEERANTDIKVLQLTDTQIIDSAQKRTDDRLDKNLIELWDPDNMEALCGNHIRSVIAQSKPDVIILTGDNVYGEFDDNGTSMKWLCKTMDSFKIPWIPIFGNHDNESKMGINWQCKQFINSEYCVFERGDVTGKGNGNFTVGIATGDKLVRVLNMIDTNGSNVGNSEDTFVAAGIYPKQIEMFEAKAKRIEAAQGVKVPSFMAFHIQTADFVEADKRYAKNPSDTYTIGENEYGDFGSKGGSLENSLPSILDFARNCNTEAVFVGHEHKINTAISYEGIKWVFGLKTGQYDTHTKGQIGGTEIVLNGSSFSVAHVYSKAPYFE